MNPAQSAESDRVEVDRSDLAWALKYMTIDGAHTARVHQRLTEALQQFDGQAGDSGVNSSQNEGTT